MPNSVWNLLSGNPAAVPTYCSGPALLGTRLQKLLELPQKNQCAPPLACKELEFSEIGHCLTLLASS